MTARPQVPAHIVTRLRAACVGLPDGCEEKPWVGTRWRVWQKTFAHVLMIDGGWPPAYAEAAQSSGCVLTFRTRGRAFDPAAFDHAPYFRPVWFPNIMGLRLGDATDWDEVGKLVEVSYRVMAPARLVEQLDRIRSERERANP